MNILIVGVSGFIGQHLYHALSQCGYNVTGCSRHEVHNIKWQSFSFNQSAEDWECQLKNIDIVINAAGIYQESDAHDFLQTHELGPKKLFEVCARLGIKVIQISAIGAEIENPTTDFLISKRNADQSLLESDRPNIVLYPGIVLGERGRSTRQLSLLARLPLMPLVFGRNKKLPLISIYQLTEHIIKTIQHWPKAKQASVLIAKEENMEQLLNNLKNWMGLGKGYFISIPKQLINLGFKLLPGLSVGAFNKQSIELLSEYSNRSYSPISNTTASDSLLKHAASATFKKALKLRMLFYVNLIALGIIWIVSGISSLVSFEQSRELITSIGINGLLGDSIIIGAAIGDIFLGIFLWHPGLRRYVIYTQIAVMLIYSLIISIALPIFWLHPFAPIIKNLAMLVLALYLLTEETE